MAKFRLKIDEKAQRPQEPTLHRGTLYEWNDDRGFGFITPEENGSPRVFLHVSNLRRGTRRPVLGDVFFYTLSSDERGRPRAIDAYTGVLSEKRSVPFPFNFGRLFANCSLIPCILVAVFMLWTKNAIVSILIGYLLNSFLTTLCYRTDKYLAQYKYYRIPEASLHLWEFFWGWPGAIIAQRKFRHKSSKKSYRAIFGGCVVLNCQISIVLAILATPDNIQQVATWLAEFCQSILEQYT